MNDFVQALAPLAWRELWQVSLVALGVALIVGFCCSRRAHLAHVLWLVVLIKCLTPPLWSSPSGVFSWAGAERAAVPVVAGGPGDDSVAATRDSVMVDSGALAKLETSRLESTASPPPLPREVVKAAAPASSLRATTVLASLWLAGAVIYAVTALVVTTGCLRKLRRDQTELPDWVARLRDNLRERLGIRRRVRLVVTRAATGPLTFGWVRATIVIPRALVEGRSADELEPLLAHELIHVRRGDAWIGLLQMIAQCLWWFHPLVWWANRQMAAARERCCDEEVVAGLGCPPARYARSLLGVLELKGQARWLAGLQGVRSFEVTRGRLEYLMAHSPRFRARMPRTYWLVLAVGLLVLLPGAGLDGQRGLAAPPENRSDGQSKTAAPAGQPVSAARLMQTAYDSFAWVERARTFRIRTKYQIVNLPQEIRWKDKHPDKNPFASKPQPQPWHLDKQWAWDTSRVHYSARHYDQGKESEAITEKRVWDGLLGVEMSKLPEHDQYVLGNKVETFFNEHLVTNMTYVAWGPGGAYHFWWLPTDVQAYRESRYVLPSDFKWVRREELDGRQCHVIESPAGHYRMYVGVEDGRLYQRTWLYVPTKAPGYDYLAILQRIAGPSIKTTFHFEPWLESLQEAERKRAWREVKVAQFRFARPVTRHKLGDYREVAPGCWLPFRQEVDTFNLDAPEPFLATRSEEIVTGVAVNEPLDDELFHVDLKDGGYVATDWRYDPFIRYTYSQGQTEAQRQALCAEARRKQEEAAADMKQREAVIESRLGQTPPPLPQSGWLNGDPLSWDKLRGKVVVLNFWDVDCGPCNNELPFLEGWHENLAKAGIVVIGVHRPTNDLAAVHDKLDKFGITYPVLIDLPPQKPDGLGQLHDWFGNSWWPHSVLIDRTGAIAGHGRIWPGDLGDQMRELARQPGPGE